MVRRRQGYHPGSYSDKALLGALEDYPRLELLQVSVNELTETFSGIMGLEERRKTRSSCARIDLIGSLPPWCTCPRSLQHCDVRYRIRRVFRQEFDLECHRLRGVPVVLVAGHPILPYSAHQPQRIAPPRMSAPRKADAAGHSLLGGIHRSCH